MLFYSSAYNQYISNTNKWHETVR